MFLKQGLRLFHIVFALLVGLTSSQAKSSEFSDFFPPVKEERPTFLTSESAFNFGIVYAAQWSYYVVGQRDAIKTDGSFKNWTHYPFRPHFDRDSFDYNIYKHSLTGNYYYLWYRSRGNDRAASFAWAFISSLAFEFSIETITEKPSYQDIFQTPVFGTVVGMGSEKLSEYFHSLDTWYGHTFGYILNPFTLIPGAKTQNTTFTPYINENGYGAAMSLRY